MNNINLRQTFKNKSNHCYIDSDKILLVMTEDRFVEVVNEMMKPLINNNLSLKWWCNLSFEDKFYKLIEWYKSKGGNLSDKHPHTLTYEELYEIYKFFN